MMAMTTGEECEQDGARCRIGSRSIFVLFFCVVFGNGTAQMYLGRHREIVASDRAGIGD